MHGSQCNCGECCTTTDCRALRGPDQHQHSISYHEPLSGPSSPSQSKRLTGRCMQTLHAAAPPAVTTWVPCYATHHLQHKEQPVTQEWLDSTIP
jgi:hypothetical protein